MAHGRADHCGCFPTGVPYPGIADLLLRAPQVMVGLAEEIESGRTFAELPLAVIDTETTGRDPARGDRIIEIAIVHFDGAVVSERHAILVDPGIPIPADASAVHGISDADVRGKPKWEAVAKDVLGLLKGRVPVAYNAGFDRAFVFSEMRRAGTSPSNDRTLPPALRSNVEWIDPLLWARAVQPTAKGFKLGEVAERLGIALVRAHRATDDAEAAGQVLHALMREGGNAALPYREVVQKQREHAAAFDRIRANWRR
jgi:DNA polymerase-3 subunit epsilon